MTFFDLRELNLFKLMC